MRFKLAVLTVVLLAAVVSAQQGKSPSATKLPPLVYVCTMAGDEGVLEDKPGRCPNPKCGMELVPIRLESKWWCPTHQTLVVQDGPGRCPRDGKELVQVTLSEFWTCADKAETKLLEPGNCSDGKARKIGYEVRAHGDHNPRHDGQFFMATDQWHHVEGAYPSPGLFRAFFYDNFTKPLPPKNFSGTFVVLDKADKELGSFPLVAARDRSTLEAKLPAALSGLPLKGAAKIKFGPAIPEQRFDFAFAALSKDPAPTPPAAAPVTTGAAAARPTPASPKPAAPAASTSGAPARPLIQAPAAPVPVAAAAPPPAEPVEPRILDKPLQVPPALAEVLDESKLPTTTPGLIAELTSRAKEVESLVSEGSLSQVWLPAMGTKTVALVLDSRASALPERQRLVVSSAVKRIVTASWEIDAYGDLGNRQKLTDAYQRLASAVAELKAAYAQ